MIYKEKACNTLYKGNTITCEKFRSLGKFALKMFLCVIKDDHSSHSRNIYVHDFVVKIADKIHPGQSHVLYMAECICFVGNDMHVFQNSFLIKDTGFITNSPHFRCMAWLVSLETYLNCVYVFILTTLFSPPFCPCILISEHSKTPSY